MIEIICDNCDRPFEVDDAEAGGKIRCPMCGDVNRVRAGKQPEPAPVGAPAAVAGAVAADATRRKDGPEREICVVRPAMFRAHPLRYAAIVAIFIGGLVLAGAAAKSDKVWPWLTWPGLLISLASAVWWVKWLISTYFWIRVSISNKRTVRHEGIIRRHSTEVLHDHVRSVDINQDFLQRIFNVGYIGIDSAGQDGIEIEIRDIPGPYEVKKIIDQYRAM